MRFRYRAAAIAKAVLGFTIFSAVFIGAGEANAGACSQDGLINLYASKCGAARAEHPSGPAPVQDLAKQTSYDGSQRLQPVRFEKAVVLEVESRAARGIPAGFVRFGVRCFRNETNLAFYFPQQEMSDYRERSEILYQVDGGAEKVLELKLAGTANNILGVWEGYRAVPFLMEILQGGSLYLNALDKQYLEIEVEFDIDDLRTRINSVRDQCHW